MCDLKLYLLLSFIIWGTFMDSVFSSLTVEDKQQILNLHNWVRLLMSSGANGFPPIANMQTVDWSSDLEKEAKKRILHCKSNFKVYTEPNAKKGYLLFRRQVIDASESLVGYSLFRDALTIINNSKIINCDVQVRDCEIINQVLETRLSSIGCSLRKCGMSDYVLACMYNHRPSIMPHLQAKNIGFPCSKCPVQFSYCLRHTLCSSKSQCLKTTDNKCECTLSWEKCEKHGHFIKSQCLCLCKEGFRGKFCEDRKSIIHSTKLRKSEDPVIQFINPAIYDNETKLHCKNRQLRCSLWKVQGLCNLKTVRNDCILSCCKCTSDETWIKKFAEILIPAIEVKECVDTKPECQSWADKNYCYVKAVQKMCPKVCAMCPDPASIEDFGCKEESTRSKTCKQVIEKYLCYSPDMKEICPLTCGNTKCGTPLPSTTLKDPCLQPQSHFKPCEDFKKVGYCNAEDVREYCPVTCQVGKCETDPAPCLDLTAMCDNEAIKTMCKATCASTTTSKSSTSGSSKSSTSSTTDPAPCLDLTKMCDNPAIKAMCKATCAKSSTSQSSTSGSSISSSTPKTSTTGSSKSSTLPTTDPTPCRDLKNMCSNPAIKEMCKATCATTTTLIYSSSPSSERSSTSKSPTSGSSKSSTIKTTDPTPCLDLTHMCENPAIKAMCKATCETTTTSETSTSGSSKFSILPTTDPTPCLALTNMCSIPAIKVMCKATCATTTEPKSSTSKSIKSSTLSSTDPTLCPNLQHLCKSSDAVRKTCPATCSTTPKISASSTSSMMCSTPMGLDELEECSKMAPHCGNPGVSDLCPITCGQCGSTVVPHTEEPEKN